MKSAKLTTDFITIDEAAKRLDAHPNTIRNHIKRGNLPNTFKKGRVVLVYAPDLALLDEQQPKREIG